MRPTHAGLFHVTSRSIAEEHIFRDDLDYHAGVQTIAELATQRCFICHEFCLMPTHYHLLASFEQGMLSDAIHRLNRRYASGFNRRHGRRGHVFDSPFTSVEVVTERHAFRLSDYIAENPPYRPWPWSSFDADFSFVQRLL
jgi:REP element-mobilizing transposase RayT